MLLLAMEGCLDKPLCQMSNWAPSWTNGQPPRGRHPQDPSLVWDWGIGQHWYLRDLEAQVLKDSRSVEKAPQPWS